MPRRIDIKSVLIIGAGPIVIGQACEFDYSGAQACKALKEEGLKVILVNSNPATIMTDPELADVTYIEPITTDTIEQIIKVEKPDAILPTMGGQTALNIAIELDKAGTDSDRVFKLIAKCIESIFTKESVYDRTEHSDQEFEEFIEGLSPEFFAKLTDFFTTIPNMNNTLEFTCPKCQKKTKVEVSNIEDFFT